MEEKNPWLFRGSNGTVDGQNPAPPRMMIIPLFIGLTPLQPNGEKKPWLFTPGKTNGWNLRVFTPGKGETSSKPSFFRFHVKLQGCRGSNGYHHHFLIGDIHLQQWKKTWQLAILMVTFLGMVKVT